MADDYDSNSGYGNGGGAGVLADEGNAAFDVSPSSVSFGAEGGTRVLTVTRGRQSSWSVSSDTVPSWLTVSPTSGTLPEGMTGTVTLAAEANGSAEARGASLQFTDGREYAYVSVTQAGVEAISVEPSSLSFGSEGGEATAAVTSSAAWAAVSDSTWLTVSPVSGDGDGAVAVTAAANDALPSSERRGEVAFSTSGGGASAVLTVTQAAVPALSLDPPSVSFGAGGGTAAVQVTSSDGTAEVGGLPDWAAAEWGGGLLLRLTAAANVGGVARSAEARVYNGAGAEAALHLEQAAAHVREHYGEFPDIRGAVWRVEIMRRGGVEAESADLDFPADSPLVIEWPSMGFEEVMWGSSATLRLVSPGDRTYTDLYTEAPGDIRLDVYRDGSLFWSGALDPEFYEEPYERLNGYEVALTFTDLGVLDRLKYDLAGVVSVGDMLDRALELSGLNVAGFNSHACAIMTADLRVDSANFTDEEGEVMSWHEALEGVLTPLGVRLGQRAGELWLFDLEGLEEWYGPDPYERYVIEWAGDSQTLGVDRVYNGVTVTFSPYAQSSLADGDDDVEYGGKYDAEHVNTTSSYPADPTDPDYGDYHTFWTAGSSYTDPDLTVFLSDRGSGFAELPAVWAGYRTYDSGQYFHILPVLGSAEECTGALVCLRPYADNYNTMFGGTLITRYCASEEIYRSGRVWLRPLPEGDAARLRVRVEVPMLLDARQNPWDGDDRQAANQETLETDSRWLFLKAAINLYGEGGEATMHYSNAGVAEGSSAGRFDLGSWVSGEDWGGDCWLEWYDPDDPEGSSAVGGWNSNRHCVGRPDGRSGRETYSPSRRFREAPDGEYLPYPPQGGWLDVTVYGGIQGYRWREGVDFGAASGTAWDSDAIYGWAEFNEVRLAPATIIRWWLLKAPTVEVVRNDTALSPADTDDEECAAVLDADARDDLSVDTICGTAQDAPPNARGLFLNADGSRVTELSRDGYTARPEKLLIAQLYRQYAGRKTVLTGEAEHPEALLLSERNQGDALFVLCAETLDARAATSEIEVRELGEDRYTSE